MSVTVLDKLVRDSLCEFTDDVFADDWAGKEHESVNRFVHGNLFKRRKAGTRGPDQVAAKSAMKSTFEIPYFIDVS